MSEKTVIYADSLSDVFFQKKAIPSLKIVGGCTAGEELPDMFLSVLFNKDLKLLERRERYVEMGPAVTLAQILELGSEHLPSVFYDALSSVANPQIRNIATIGGNICAEGYKHTVYSPLLALEARLEFQKPRTNGIGNESLYVPFLKFDRVPEDYVLTKIRIPVEEWDVAVFRRLGPSNEINANSASFTFLANSQKGMLANLRIAFAGPFSFRSTELENRLIGTNLPLSEAATKDLVDEASIFYDEAAFEKKVKPILKQQFLNILRFSLAQLT
ncbi:MAG: FAD binding domain-containing protein [Treponema sp.]|nr:FAD binding domain-containing protein [Treponema sp.]